MGLILPQMVEIKVNYETVQKYIDLGYDIPMVKTKDGKRMKPDTSKTFLVSAEHLNIGSKYKVNLLCDYCNETVFRTSIASYYRMIKSNGKCVCKNCVDIKIREMNMIKYGVEYTNQDKSIQEKREKTNLERYGTPYVGQVEEFKEKAKQTNLEKYGCESPSQNEEVKKKIRNTNSEKYGCECASQSEEVKSKIRKTNLKRYGCESPFSNKDVQDKIKKTNLEKYGVENCFESSEIQDKIKATNLKKYGVEYPTQSEELFEKVKDTNMKRYGVEFVMQSNIFREKAKSTNLKKYGYEYIMGIPEFQIKAANSMYANGNVKTSTQQYNIYTLLKEKYTQAYLNYPIGNNLHGDIVIDNIDFEIDYGGHDLNVKFGTITQSEFLEKQIKRDNIVKSEGYKLIRLISDKERKIPTQDKLIEIFELSKKFFEDNPERSWIEFHIEKGIYRNAMNKDGVLFDFGELVKATKEKTA